MGRPKKLKRTYVAVSEFRRLLRQIERVKTVEGLDIVKTAIESAYHVGRINDTERQVLYAKLSDKASKVGERKISVKLGLFSVGVEKKGTMT